MKSTLAILILIQLSLSCFGQIQDTALVEIAIYNAKTGEPLNDYTIHVQNRDSTIYNTKIEHRESLRLFLEKEREYSIILAKKDYIKLAYSLNTQTTCYSEGNAYHLEFFLEPIEIICCSPLPEIEFSFNSHILTDSSKINLSYFCELMMHNPNLTFELKGLISKNEYKTLSIQRAFIVKNWLIESGIEKDRLTIWYDSEELNEMKSLTEDSYMQRMIFSILRHDYESN